MTVKQLARIIQKTETQAGRLKLKLSKKTKGSQSYRGLLAIAGMWKDNPRTEKDLAEVRRRLWVS